MIKPSLRLLLIDDDEDIFVLVRDFVAETAPDWSVDWASTYEAGIAGLTTGNYDAALLDYHLGAHTGVELLESLRTMNRLPPIVLLTGQGDRAIDLAAMATGASDYLEKGSLSPLLLERAIRHAIEREQRISDLRTSEAQYRGLFERAGDAVLIADNTGRYVDANPAACELLGVTREEAIGRSLTDFVDPSMEMPDPKIAWEWFLAAGEMRGHVKLRRPDGSVRDADFLATANFTPGRHLSVLRDDTERLAAQTALINAVDALSSSESRFRSALDGVALHALILDLDGRILFVNRSLVARTGWSDDELLGTLVFEWVLPDPAATEPAEEAYRDGVRADVFLSQIETVFRTKAKGEVRIAWTNSAIRDGTGGVIAIASIGEDVTAQREAEATRARLAAAIEQVTESIIVMDAAGRVIYANPAFEVVSGVPIAKALGREPAKVFKGSAAAIAYPRVGQRLRSGQPWSGEFHLARPDGSLYQEEVTISPVRDPGGPIVNYVRVGRDVTRLRQIETSLETTTLERAAFASALAHLQLRATPEETARDIADGLLKIRGIQLAMVLSFDESGAVHGLALASADANAFQRGWSIVAERAARLRVLAAGGAWCERYDEAHEAGQDMTAWDALALRGVAYAPITNGQDLLGLVVSATVDEHGAARMSSYLSATI